MKKEIFKLKLNAYLDMISEQYKTWMPISTWRKINFLFSKVEIENACTDNKYNFYVSVKFTSPHGDTYTDTFHVSDFDFVWVIKDTWIVHNENGPAFKIKDSVEKYYALYGKQFYIAKWLGLTGKEHLAAFL